jgi:hypothetical protein
MTAAFPACVMDPTSPGFGDGVMKRVASVETHQTTTSPDLPAAARRAEERLSQSTYLALRRVSCFAGGNAIYLSGCLPSHYLKQVAQEMVLGVEGVGYVINRIIVPTPAPGRGSGRATRVNSSIGVEFPHQSS